MYLLFLSNRIIDVTLYFSITMLFYNVKYALFSDNRYANGRG